MQWLVAGLLQKNKAPQRMQEIKTYEDALKKSQGIESNEDCYTLMIDRRTEESQRIKEKLEMMKRTIQDLSMRNVDLWSTLYMTKGHTKIPTSTEMIEHGTFK